ncbi:hypothetical protein [Ancylobacter terrae]|uniref:hypothetical protein n=1 Tax=Ancylobacter sp. sgz301288 TaxID=3342077 RepID=UPI00385ED97A
MINRTTFFAYARRAPFGGSLRQAQIDGMEAILKVWEATRLPGSAPARHWLAYILATAFHETDATMQPIREYGRGKGKPYGKPGRNRGQVAYGRGFVQLTWDDNYERADRELKLGGKLIANYDLAMRPDIAAEILVRGMIEGWFTRKKLGDYFIGAMTDALGARRIVNGTDKAKLIASHYTAFLGALEAADAKMPQPADVAPEMAKADDVPVTRSGSIATVATSAAGAGAALIAGIDNPWTLAALALLVVAGGVGAWLLLTGRVELKRLAR